MTLVIFSGPTLDVEEIGRHLVARCLPPAGYGDVYRAVSLFQPRTLAIVDGYFNQVPAVWHKEILWAMNRGVRVFGASSMGALRAAELDGHGMQGVGEIYAAYRDGRFPPYDDTFDRDDEVAVVHGPAEAGFRAVSEALVNIRATLAAAAREGIVDETVRDRLVALAKRRFYAERTYATLLADAAEAGLDAGLLADLRGWVDANRIDQKQRDARQLLARLAEDDPRDSRSAGIEFPHTTLWDNAVRELERLPAAASPVLDELRLLGPDYFALRDDVVEAALGGGEPGQSASGVPAAADDWFAQPLHGLELQRFRAMAPHAWVTDRMLARLAESGDLDSLERRAEDKRRRLAGRPARAADLSELELLQLMDWYFDDQLGEQIPDDLERYAEALGGLEVDAFHDLVLAEYRYRHAEP